MTDHFDLIERLRAACVGHPSASIAWPHRILHEAADALSSQSLSLSEARAENDRKDAEIERLKGLVAGIRETRQELIQRIASLIDENAEVYSENAMDRAFLGNAEELAGLIVQVQELSAPLNARKQVTIIDDQPFGWGSPLEWDMEQAAFHAVGRADVPADVQALISTLWKQYVLAAAPKSGLVEAGQPQPSALENGPAGLADATKDPADSDLSSLRKGAEVAGWQPMSTAPKDGKHCILSVPSGAFFYSVQGAFQNGQWNAVHQDNVNPVAWMPNVLLPDHLMPAALVSGSREDGA